MSRQRRRGKQRGRARLPQFVVFCEGDTEAQYVNYVRSHLPQRAIAFRVEQPGSARKTLAQAANRAVEELSKEGDLDWSVWVLCDVDDEGPTLLKLGAAGAQSRFGWAVSNPAIAAWLLMHVESVNRHEHRDVFAQWASKEGLLSGRRHKTLEVAALKGKAGRAVSEAMRLRGRHKRDGTLFPSDNPSSTVDRMLEAIVSMYNGTPAGRSSPITVEDIY